MKIKLTDKFFAKDMVGMIQDVPTNIALAVIANGEAVAVEEQPKEPKQKKAKE